MGKRNVKFRRRGTLSFLHSVNMWTLVYSIYFSVPKPKRKVVLYWSVFHELKKTEWGMLVPTNDNWQVLVKFCIYLSYLRSLYCQEKEKNWAEMLWAASFIWCLPKIRKLVLTFKCARARCKTCPFIRNVEKISGPKRSIKITDHFTCTSAIVIYCITCTLCKKLYIGETGRRLGDRLRGHLRDVEKDDKDASKPIARHFNLDNHSMQHMAVCGVSLHQRNKESRKTLAQKFIFQIGTLDPNGINERFSFN